MSGPVSFVVFCRSSPLRVVFWKNFRERTFVFGWLCWSCVFWWVFAIVFALFFGVSLPKLFGKMLFMSGLVFFWVRLSSSSFSVFFFPRDIAQVVTGHPFTRACFACSFSLFVSRRLCLFRPFWPCVLLLGVFFSGCHSGPCAVLGFSWNFRGLSSLAPSEAPFFGREAARVFCVFLVLFFFFC